MRYACQAPSANASTSTPNTYQPLLSPRRRYLLAFPAHRPRTRCCLLQRHGVLTNSKEGGWTNRPPRDKSTTKLQSGRSESKPRQRFGTISLVCHFADGRFASLREDQKIPCRPSHPTELIYNKTRKESSSDLLDTVAQTARTSLQSVV